MGRQFTKKVPKDSKIHLRRSSGGAHRRNEEPKSIRGVVNDYADVKRGATLHGKEIWRNILNENHRGSGVFKKEDICRQENY